MPAITSGKVLVTGANGYIAVWVVKAFLDKGFAVRGTVRAENKATHLRSLFKSFGDKFEVVVVEDITKVSIFQGLVVSTAYADALTSIGRRVRRSREGRRRYRAHRLALPLQGR